MKYVNTLNVGDKLFEPSIEDIKEIEIKKIEKTEEGIKIGTRSYYYELSDSDFNSAISPIVFFKKRTRHLYIRIEDAQIKQRSLQLSELKRKQSEVDEAIASLHVFIGKYFNA